jgi:hypothetical protein
MVTIEELNQLLKEEEDRAVGMGFNLRTILPKVKLSNSLSFYGRCQCSNNVCQIYISKHYLNAPIEEIRAVIMHEVLHTIQNSHGHDAVWRNAAIKAQKNYNYLNGEYHLHSHPMYKGRGLLPHTELENTSKPSSCYVLECQKCGKKIIRKKACKMTKHPEWFIHQSCGGKIKLISSPNMPKDGEQTLEMILKENPNVRELVVPNNTTKIKAHACEGKSSLSKVVLPDTVTSIGVSAFRDCYCLQEINLSKELSSIGTKAFDSCLSLNSIEMSAKVKKIGDCAFYKCTNMLYIKLSDNLKEIGAWAFQSCTRLEAVKIPNKVKTIHEGAFYDCVKLEKVILPDNIKTIEGAAFKGCINLKEVVWNNKTYVDLIELEKELKSKGIVENYIF